MSSRGKGRTGFWKICTASAIVLVLVLGPPAGATAFVKKFGEHGTGTDQLYHPYDIATYTEPGTKSPTDVYVMDHINHRVQKFDGAGNFLMTIGEGVGQADGQLYYPDALAVSNDGLVVYVADTGNHRIVEFGATSGEFIRKWGTSGSGDGQFANPDGIAVDPSGNIYVADRLNYRIQKFSSTGTFIKKWGTFGTGNGEFIVPAGIAVSSDTVFVSDEQAGTIQEFTLDGVFLRKYGEKGSEPGQLDFPDEISVDEFSLDLYVAEAGNSSRVTVFNIGGDLLGSERLRGTFTGTASPATSFSYPHAVVYDHRSETVFVASTNESAIYKFSLTGAALNIVVDPNKKASVLKDKNGLNYKIRHTEMMDPCMIKASGKLKVPVEGPFGMETDTFGVEGPRAVVKPKTLVAYEIPLEGRALRTAKEALNEHRTLRVNVTFKFLEGCRVSTAFDETVQYSISG